MDELQDATIVSSINTISLAVSTSLGVYVDTDDDGWLLEAILSELVEYGTHVSHPTRLWNPFV